MRIAVTGSNGRLGMKVKATLEAAGHDIIGIDRSSTIHPVDACNIDALMRAMQGAEAVCHLGGYPAFVESGTAAGFSNNTQATYNIFESAERLKINRIIYASSIQAYGFGGQPGFDGQAHVTPPDYLPVDERHPLRPANAYPLSKMLGEEIAKTFARRNAALSVWSLRFTWIPTPELLVAAREDHSRLPPLANLWSYISLADAARAVLLACKRYVPGHRALNIASEHSVFAWSEAAVPELFGMLPAFRRDVDTKASLIDTGAAREALGFIPTE